MNKNYSENYLLATTQRLVRLAVNLENRGDSRTHLITNIMKLEGIPVLETAA